MTVSPPAALASLPLWLTWREVPDPVRGKARKVPVYSGGGVRHGAQGSTEDRSRLVKWSALPPGARAGLALLPGAGVVALDFDDVVDEAGEVDPRVEALVASTYCEYSPSGRGVRAFFRGELVSRKSLDGAAGFKVEFFGDSGFVTFTGRPLPLCELVGCEDVVAPLPPAVQALYDGLFGEAPMAGGDSEPLGLSLERMAEALARIDPDCDHDTWLRAGMSVHTESDGSDEGLALWDDWSADSAKYPGADALAHRWASFGRREHGPRVTGATLLHLAGMSRFDPATADEFDDESEAPEAVAPPAGAALFARLQAEVEACTDGRALQGQLVPRIVAVDGLSDGDRMALLSAAHGRLKAEGRVPARRDTWIKSVLAKTGGAARDREDTREAPPQWLQGWSIERSTGLWVAPWRGARTDGKAFHAMFAGRLPADESGNRPGSASKWVTDRYEVPLVEGTLFVPGAGRLVTYQGGDYINAYDDSEAPKARRPGQWTEAERAAVARVEAHIEWLLPNPRERALFTSWLAHNVQRPGVKIRWAVHLAGTYGAGKSFFGQLLGACLGGNVWTTRKDDLEDKFNRWANAGVVVMLEELDDADRRRSLLESLKEYITNDTISVRAMYAAAANVPNHSNYFAPTNNVWGLPLPQGDRRWFVVEADVSAEQAAAMEWAPLYQALQDHPGALRGWLMAYDLHPEFDANGHAPMTDIKQAVMSFERSAAASSALELLDRLRGVGAPGVAPDLSLVESRAFFDLLERGAGGDDFGTSVGHRARQHVMAEAGYTLNGAPRSRDHNGNYRRIWRKAGVVVDQGAVDLFVSALID